MVALVGGVMCTQFRHQKAAAQGGKTLPSHCADLPVRLSSGRRGKGYLREGLPCTSLQTGGKGDHAGILGS
jgi:hypothetical protein